MKGISLTTYVLNRVKNKFKLRNVTSLLLNWLSCFLIFPCQVSSIQQIKFSKDTSNYSFYRGLFRPSKLIQCVICGPPTVLSEAPSPSSVLGLPLEVHQTDPKHVQWQSSHAPDFPEGSLLRQEVYRSACRTWDTGWVLGMCLCLTFFHLVNMAV